MIEDNCNVIQIEKFNVGIKGKLTSKVVVLPKFCRKVSHELRLNLKSNKVQTWSVGV